MIRFHLHLISDATGETVHSVARACMVQFEGVEPVEHNWPLVRNTRQLDQILQHISEAPGVVLFTLVNDELRLMLQDRCRDLQVPCIPVLDPVIGALASFLGVESRGQPGKQHALDAEYFHRIDALQFALNHDDGQAVWGLRDADVILVGVSRTSKSPTCIYLANRGIKAANVPVVPGVSLPDELFSLSNGSGPLIVALTKDPARLVQIRRNRLHQISGSENDETDYVDLETVKSEVATARRLYGEHEWPVIDVSRRSIEETAAAIMQLLERRRA